ncbi:MAG: dipeptidase, partial [Lachnospiraceae bacterium]|nr:dipeptidase [Lachnospiraceae bacterium]
MDIKVKEEYLAQALKLHRTNPVVDAHLDLAGEVLLRHQAGEREVVKRYYLPHFKEAALNMVFSSVYVESGNLSRGWENALEQINALKEDIKGLSGVVLVKNSGDMDKVLEENKIGILLYMEGLDCIGEDIDRLDVLYGLGVRGASLTWSRQNALGRGCCKASEYRQISGRLTKAGERAVKRLEELSMFLDVSHLNDEGFDHVCKLAERSFIATHSGSRSVYDNFRNLTDAQILALSGQGGIMGMNGCKYIAGSLAGNHIEMLCRHIEYEGEKAGPEHGGFGFDLCDSYD